MKKAILILGAAFVIAGCNQDQGGNTDTYSTGSGTNTSSSRSSSRTTTNAPAMTSTNQSPRSTP